jgi:hypothetical protein
VQFVFFSPEFLRPIKINGQARSVGALSDGTVSVDTSSRRISAQRPAVRGVAKDEHSFGYLLFLTFLAHFVGVLFHPPVMPDGTVQPYGAVESRRPIGACPTTSPQPLNCTAWGINFHKTGGDN